MLPPEVVRRLVLTPMVIVVALGAAASAGWRTRADRWITENRPADATRRLAE